MPITKNRFMNMSAYPLFAKFFPRRALGASRPVLFGLALALWGSANGLAQTKAQVPLQARVLAVAPAVSAAVPDKAVFALKLAQPLKEAPRAFCDIMGIRSSVPVEVIKSPQREAVLASYGIADTASTSTTPWLVLRCQSTLPDGAPLSLRWMNPEAKPASDHLEPGSRTWESQNFDYTVLSDVPAVVQCGRVNADAACNPLESVQLRFSKAVSVKDAALVRLKGADGQTLKPQAMDESEWTDVIAFQGLKAEHNYRVEWPSKLAREGGGDALAKGKTKSRLDIQTGAYPPLAKFGADFGIAERGIGGVVPLTLRAVDGLPGVAPARLRQLHLSDETAIIEVLQTLRQLNARDDRRGYYNGGDGEDESGAAAEVSRKKTKAKLRYPFAWPKAPKGGDEGEGDEAETRHLPWIKTFKEAQQMELPRQLEGKAFEVLGIPLAEPGLHVLEVESVSLGKSLLGKNQAMYVRSGALVTDLAVHMHSSDRTLAAWVTRLSTGQVVPQAAVTVYDCRAKRLASGTSNEQGWVQIDLRKANDEYGCPLYVFARQGDDLGLVQSNWQRGIESWRFGELKNIYEDANPQKLHAVLARNLLRGGEMLQARLYWRELSTKGVLGVPDVKRLPKSVTLAHKGSNERKSVAVTWDARGNAELSYKLPDAMKRGVWQIETTVPVQKGEFRVEDFRLPLLKAEVLSPSKVVTLPLVQPGKPASLTVPVRLSYLSGGVAAGESVTIAQRLLRHTPRFDNYPAYRFGLDATTEGESASDAAALEGEADGESVAADLPRQLDAQGSLVSTAKLTTALNSPRQLLTEMEYRDPNGETYRAQGRTTLWPAAVIVGMNAGSWASGKVRTVELIALDTQGKPAANIALTVNGAFEGSTWYRRKTVGGYYSYQQEQRHDTPKVLCQGRSDAAGRFTCRYEPELGSIDSGEFRLQAQAQDAQGRKVMASTSVWLYDGGEVWFGQSDHDRMDVLAEKPSYKPGESAVLQLRSPFREATAWVNVMRAGAIIDTLVLPVSGTSPTLTLPIKPSYAPNVFVNVLAVRPRVAEPAATALVDLARPAYKLGLVHLSVNSEHQRLSVQVSTDKPAYQSRETAKVTIQVKAAAGQALPADREVTVFAIDEALLELLPNRTWDVLETMMAQSGYGFESASASMQVIGKRHFGRKALPAGGGGGKSAARELFDTLLLWKAVVALDAQGRAQVDVPVNDSLTRFKVVAVANAGTDRFGWGSASFAASKDLQILSGLPASVRQGDRLSASFTLRNTTEQVLQVKVDAALNDQALPAQSLTLKPQQTQLVVWPVDIPAEASELRWKLQATGTADGLVRQDALVVRQTVSTSLMAVRYGVLAQSIASATEPVIRMVTPPKGTVPSKGELRISFAPHFATDASGVRDYMRSYPFYCLEQRTSKAVSLKDAKLWSIITGSLDDYLADNGLLNYYPLQPSERGEGYDVLTSYVLSAAQQAGWTLPPEAQDRMLGALDQFVRGQLERRFDYYNSDVYELTERKLLALEAIARYRQVGTDLIESLRLNPNKDLPQLSNRALVQWLDVLNRVKWPNKAAHLTPALAEFDKRLVQDASGTTVHLKAHSRGRRWYYMTSDASDEVRAALLALDMPELTAKADALARGAVMLQRPGGAWWETQANVWGSLMLDKRRALAAPVTGVTRVAVGKQIVLHDWSKQALGGEEAVPVAVAGPVNAAAVAVLHSGKGQPFVSVAGTAWRELLQPERANANLEKSVKPLKVKVPGQVSVGDIWEVQLKFQVSNPVGWVALSDPILPGATVLGGGLKGLDTVATASTVAGGAAGNKPAGGERYGLRPRYVERSFTHVRAYYEYLWNGSHSFSYQVRINAPGRFSLPPTQLEAMYDDTTFANLPNGAIEVK